MAIDGIEWMEIQAMKSGLRPRDEALVAELFSKRVARANARPDALGRVRELKQIAGDFEGLCDVAGIMASAAALESQPEIAAALHAEQAEEDRERRLKNEVEGLVRQLGWPERADTAFTSLESFVTSLLDVARQDADSPDRRIARRVVAGLRASRVGVPNKQFQAWIQQIDLPAPPPSQ
jgi:hypothetical protein